MIQVSSSSTIAKPTAQAAYVAELISRRPALPGQAPAWLTTLRDQAAAAVETQSIPTTRDEEWRFTDLSTLLQTQFATAQQQPSVQLEDLRSFLLPEAADSRLVFVDGVYAPELSAIANLPEGVVLSNLTEALTLKPELETYLGQQQGTPEVFTGLNTAGFVDAAIVWVPKNQVVETPIQILFVATGDQSVLIQPRCLVVAETGGQVALVEAYVHLGSAQSPYWTNAVTEIQVEPNAQVNHTRLQREGQTAFHIGKTAVTQARDSVYTATAINLGAQVSRHHPEVYQTGEQTETVLNGLAVIAGEQLSDTHSTIAFTKPHGRSQQLHKCIVDDRGHAVFNGKVYVPKAAQLTDAGQLNRNLLLSPKARVDTKPQLEIVADNVKCTHGAAVGQLDAEEVFYLQSRGLDQETARKLLVYAFAIEIIDQIPIASLQSQLAELVSYQRLAASPNQLIAET
jgi:Fe-S cluster assembly protein SufD